MKKWRVFAECVIDSYLDVEAETEEEAKEIAENADGGDFTVLNDGDFRITYADEY